MDETVELWTPKEVWQRYRDIAAEEIPLEFPANPNLLRAEARRLRAQIEHTLTDKLRRGELIACGLPMPLDVDTRRSDIPSELWSRLKLDIRHEEASGDGLRVVELRFRTVEATRAEQPPAAAAGRQPVRRRSAGRPSIMPMIEAEMRQRAANARMEPTLRREVEVLAIWARREFADDVHVPKAESIERKLGRIYRELQPTKRPDN